MCFLGLPRGRGGDRGRQMGRGSNYGPYSGNQGTKRPHSLENAVEKRTQKEFSISHLVPQELRAESERAPEHRNPEDKRRKLEIQTETNLTIGNVRTQLGPIVEALESAVQLLIAPLNSMTVANLSDHWKGVGSGHNLVKAAGLFNIALDILQYFRNYGNPDKTADSLLGIITAELEADVKGPLNNIMTSDYLELSDEEILKNLKDIERVHMVRLTHACQALESLEAMAPVMATVVRAGLPSTGLNSETKQLQVQFQIKK